MKLHKKILLSAVCAAAAIGNSTLAAEGWSVVPHVGLSLMQDQSPAIEGLENAANGGADVSLEDGFTAGLSGRYYYPDSRWVSEFGWEYRSNDSSITTADGNDLPDGNYASNIFYLNGRYRLTEGSKFTPWLGGGVTWTQEVDLDSEDAAGERSFSDSGSVGFQVMAGADYDLTERFYLTGELRYSTQTDIELREEGGGGGSVTEIDYQPLTLSVGVGVRF